MTMHAPFSIHFPSMKLQHSLCARVLIFRISMLIIRLSSPRFLSSFKRLERGVASNANLLDFAKCLLVPLPGPAGPLFAARLRWPQARIMIHRIIFRALKPQAPVCQRKRCGCAGSLHFISHQISRNDEFVFRHPELKIELFNIAFFNNRA